MTAYLHFIGNGHFDALVHFKCIVLPLREVFANIFGDKNMNKYVENKTFERNKVAKLVNVAIKSMAFTVVTLPMLSHAEQIIEEKENTKKIEVIEVTSTYKGSLVEAINTKRDSSNVVDVISAEDVGKFPDANLAESLQRITGVQITRDRGEGKNVSIRGLPSDFTKITLNGRSIASGTARPETNTVPRSFDFTTLSSDFVSALVVNKSPTASQVDGGLSGNVDVITPRAFRIGEEKFSGTINITNEDNTDENGKEVAALYSNVFNDETIGFTVGASYSERILETHRFVGNYNLRNEAKNKDYNNDGIINPEKGVYIPTQAIYQKIPEERERFNFLSSLEFRINDNADIYFEGLYTSLDTQTTRLANFHRFDNIAGEVDSSRTSAKTLSVLNDQGTYSDADFTEILAATGVDQRNGSRSADMFSESTTLATGLNYNFDNLLLTAEVSYSKAEQKRSYLNIATAAFGGLGGNGGMQVDFSDNGNMPLVSYFNGYDQTRLDPNNYRLFSVNGEFDRQSEDEIFEAKIDFEYALDTEYFIDIEFGMHYAERSFFLNNGRLVIGGNDLNNLLNGELQPSEALPGTLNLAPYMQEVNVSDGWSAFGGTIPSTYLSSDTRKLLGMFSDEELLAAGNFTDNPTNIFDINEETLAGYVKINFELSDYNIKGNFGVRAVETTQKSKGSASDLSKIIIEPEAGGVTTVPPGETIEVDRSYTNILPSLNLSWDYNEDTVLRFAMSKTLTRPTLDLLTPTTSVNGIQAIVNARNPELDPFESNNLDLALEWYFNDSGLLSATIFYKDLETLITNVSSIQDLNIISKAADGTETPITKPFTMNTYENTSGVTLKGFELSYQQQFDFLPGLLKHTGVLANYTFVDNSEPQLLSGASESNYNFSAYYEDELIQARLIYSYRDGFISEGLTPGKFGAQQLEYGSLDASISIDVTENVSLTFQGSNLTDEAVVTLTQTGNLPLEYQDNGRRFVVGARVNF
jgi:iron complex outermembrane receptor protein